MSRAVEHDPAVRRFDQAIDEPEQGRLARAAAPDDADHLSGFDSDGHVIDGIRLSKRLFQRVQFQHLPHPKITRVPAAIPSDGGCLISREISSLRA